MSELKLIRLSAKREFVIPLRIIFFLIAVPFLLDSYEIWVSGVADNGRSVKVTAQDGWYFVFLAKKLMIALFFIWLGTGGLDEKKPGNEAKINKGDGSI